MKNTETTTHHMANHCKICNSPTILRTNSQPGYKEGTQYKIAQCNHCNTSQAIPLKSDPNIYRYIYEHSSSIPGYSRYFRYSNEILNSSKPLAYLADCEDVYWAVKKSIESIRNIDNKIILEIGSGLGYLTYSLNEHGYNIHGIDISKPAIDEAIEKYGSLFTCSSLEDFTERTEKLYDVIILTEVIEHIEDVNLLIENLKKILSPNGIIIVTTPNKNIFSNTALWHTDPPPVHLWWFSEQSMRELASKNNMNVGFVDFTKYNQNRRQYVQKYTGNHTPTIFPRISESGQPIIRENSFRRLAKQVLAWTRLTPHFQSFRCLLNNDCQRLRKRSASLCAIFGNHKIEDLIQSEDIWT